MSVAGGLSQCHNPRTRRRSSNDKCVHQRHANSVSGVAAALRMFDRRCLWHYWRAYPSTQTAICAARNRAMAPNTAHMRRSDRARAQTIISRQRVNCAHPKGVSVTESWRRQRGAMACRCQRPHRQTPVRARAAASSSAFPAFCAAKAQIERRKQGNTTTWGVEMKQKRHTAHCTLHTGNHNAPGESVFRKCEGCSGRISPTAGRSLSSPVSGPLRLFPASKFRGCPLYAMEKMCNALTCQFGAVLGTHTQSRDGQPQMVVCVSHSLSNQRPFHIVLRPLTYAVSTTPSANVRCVCTLGCGYFS